MEATTDCLKGKRLESQALVLGRHYKAHVKE